MSTIPPTLKIENLSSEYFVEGKTIPILRNVSAEFLPGKATAIIGESGSGKTTLALAIAGLIMPWEGKITDGKILLNLKNKYINILSLGKKEMLEIHGGEIAFIPQDASAALNPVAKISIQMEEAIKNPSLSPQDKKSLIHNVLSEVKLFPADRILNSYPHQLSGGQKQRVIIAIALLNSPSVIIADEPTSGLDVAVAKEILSTLSELKNKTSQRNATNMAPTFIFITHDIRIATNFCDNSIIFYAGKICETGNVKSIIQNPKHPYTKGLIRSLPDIHKISQPLKPLEGQPPTFSSEGNLNICCSFAPRCPYKMEICLKSPPPLFEVENNSERHLAACFLYKEKTQYLR